MITLHVLRRQQDSAQMVFFDQSPDLGRNLGPFESHHKTSITRDFSSVRIIKHMIAKLSVITMYSSAN